VSLATKYDVENVIEDIDFRLHQHYLPITKDWSQYKITTLFPTACYLGSIYARYDIFQNEEKLFL